ncbi:hypothetical protein PLICRDRAFT_180192 [Plicaturopsis crispa FD-325 SS-3]|uniref:Uncharacterized protein n=1 Tax=Plicaturopsis crispa FD-325 SS-3 TaxID=944288 RepID=A0A0C9SKE1_PLICR|nr:hypothetical protein PLICRDRAFT_180192 [Plicaturopsis crispa FD-325 SS-3]
MDLADVLRRAVERCMEFSVKIPVVEVTSFRPRREDMTQMELAANIWYDSPDTDFTYDPRQDNFRLRTSYISIVTGLLARPHARAFIFRGGIYTRLAREFGGDNLLQRAFAGPSVQVTWHIRGRVSHANSDTMDDAVSEPEEWMLLGRVKSAGKRTSDRWLWPSPKMMRDYWMWNGEWDDNTERWFQRYLEHFRQGRAWPKTDGQWRQYLQHEQPTPYPLPLSTAGWMDLKEKLDHHDTPWKDKHVVDIVEIV